MHRLFFYLLILFLPTQLGFHTWPEWAMVLGRRIDYLSPTLFLTDTLIILMLLFWLRKIPIFPIIFLILFAGINIFFSVNRSVSLYHWIKFAEFGLLGYYIIKTKPNLSLISHLLSFSVLYSSFLAIAQFVMQHSVGGLFWLLGERTFTLDTPGIARIAIGGQEMLRAYSTFPHPNVLAGFLAVTLPLILVHTIKEKKMIYFLSFVFGIVALVVTFSRSGWIAAGFGLGWVLFGQKRIRFFILTALLVAFAVFLFHPQEESVLVRKELNEAAMKISQTRPFFGVGLGNFLIALPDYIPSRTIYFLQPVHNIYLLALTEIGIVGAIGIIWAIRKRVTMSVPLGALLLLGLVDHYLVTLQQGRILLVLFIALAYRRPGSLKNQHVG